MPYKRPGVYVSESLLASNISTLPTLPPAALVGPVYRGPIEPTNILSWSEYQTLYGGFTGKIAYTGQPAADIDLMAYAAYQYFNNGGHNLWISRVDSSAFPSVAASRTLPDREAVVAPATSPPDILQIDARNPGVWGNDLYIEITDASPGKFNLIVRYGGLADANVVERWLDMSLDPAADRNALAMINAPGGGSQYIAVANLLSSGTQYGPLIIPALTAPAAGQLTLGVSATAAPTVTAAGDYFAAFTACTVIGEPFVVNLPGVTASALVNAVMDFAELDGLIFVVLDCAAGLTPGAAITANGPNTINSTSYGAVYYPRLYIADPANTTPGTAKLVPAGAAVLGLMSFNDATRGVWRAPAGIWAQVAGTLALETSLTAANLDALNVANVNAIRTVPGSGICVFGARTLKQTQADRYINVRRTLIYLKDALTRVTTFAIFENNDELLWAELIAACDRVLLGLWQGGGLRGDSPGAAYFVKCDADNNTDSTISNGEVHVDVGVALEYPAEFIVIQIGQFASGATNAVEVRA